MKFQRGMTKRGPIKRELEEYKQNCLNTQFFPFSVVLSNKTIEFVASDLNQFKFVTQAIEEIIKLNN